MNDSPLVPQHVRLAIEAACKGAGVSLIDLGVRGQHKQLRLEVSIDAPEGVTHDHCTAVSRGIESRLHEDEFFDRLRAVDVSSPGAETPVRFLWQLSKHVGRKVRVVRSDSSVIEGTLLGADETGLDVQPSSGAKSKVTPPPVHIAASDITEARTVISL